MRRSVKIEGRSLEYELLQTQRRDVAFRILPGNLLRVYAPRSLPLREADRLVIANREQIFRASEEIRRYEEKQESLFDMKEGMRFPLEGQTAALHLEKAARFHADVQPDRVTLYLPDFAPDAVKEALRQALIAHFKGRLKERLDHYIPLIGRTPGKITVREQKTRWGSCSSQHNLNFNWLLIMAPPEALDYVVIHELCHLYEFNHSPRFWARVETYQSEYARWRAWLRSGWNHPFR